MLKECLTNLPVLFLAMGGNIAAGTIASTTVDKIEFDKKKFIDGLVKVIITAIGLIILAYAFDKIDLSSIGYTPNTVITTGIVVYSTKLLFNIIKLLGLSNMFPSTQTKARLSALETKVEANTKTIEEVKTTENKPINSDEAVG